MAGGSGRRRPRGGAAGTTALGRGSPAAGFAGASPGG